MKAATFTLQANAKLNLYLDVGPKRADGYHEIYTVIHEISLADQLHFTEAETIELECSRADLPTDERNLVIRAAQMLRRESGVQRGARIVLEKNIPVAAGLGGGSSDAAATLVGLDRLWDLGLSKEELAGVAARLGSDVPFFVFGGTCACTGRGEVVQPLPWRLILWFLLVCPPFGVPTAQAYAALADTEAGLTSSGPKNKNELLKEVVSGSGKARLSDLLFNRLEPASCRLAPDILTAVGVLRKACPLGALMSGSGSTVFAVCRNRADALRKAAEVATAGLGTIYVASSVRTR